MTEVLIRSMIIPIIMLAIVFIYHIIRIVYLLKMGSSTPPKKVFEKALKETGPNKPFYITKVNRKWEYTAKENSIKSKDEIHSGPTLDKK